MKTASFFEYHGPGRISIARFAPRGTPKGYRGWRALAPGEWFNSVSEAEYVKRFREEILGKLQPKDVQDHLLELAGGAEPVLLCWEKSTDTHTYCHRALVAQWLSDGLGERVDELGFDGKEHPLLPAAMRSGAQRALPL